MFQVELMINDQHPLSLSNEEKAAGLTFERPSGLKFQRCFVNLAAFQSKGEFVRISGEAAAIC